MRKTVETVVVVSLAVAAVGFCIFCYGNELVTEPGWSGGKTRDETLQNIGAWMTVAGIIPLAVLFFIAGLASGAGSSHRGEVQISGKDDYGNPVKVWIRTEKE